VVLRLITEADVPGHSPQVDEVEATADLVEEEEVGAAHLTRPFERYGSPCSVTKEHIS